MKRPLTTENNPPSNAVFNEDSNTSTVLNILVMFVLKHDYNFSLCNVQASQSQVNLRVRWNFPVVVTPSLVKTLKVVKLHL